MIEWLHVSHRIRSGKKCWKQRDWYWRTFIPTAAFPASGFRRFWRLDSFAVITLVAELEEAYGDALKVAKININFDLPLAEQYEVQAVPTLIFFKNGAEQDRRRGLVKKAELQEIIDSLK